jgi:hypothetical protein
MVCVLGFTLFYILLMTITVSIYRMEGVVLEMKTADDLEERED